jgi:hypothetical protein
VSGPKGFGYEVISPGELRRREDRARRARCGLHQLTLARLTAQLAAYASPPLPAVREPVPKTHEALIAWEAALTETIDAARARLRTASSEAIMARLTASRLAVDAAGVSLGERLAPSDTSATNGSDRLAADVDRLNTDVDRVVEVVASLRDPKIREELTAAAIGIGQLSSLAQAKGDLLTLKTRAVGALRAQDCRDLALNAVLEIADIDSQEANRLRALADGASTDADVSLIAREVAAHKAAQTKAADAEFVEAALAEVLAEAGFKVAEGFDLSDFGRVALAEHEDHPGYGVRFQVSPESGMLFTRVVAQRATTPEDDARVERETCAKVHGVAGRLRDRGIGTELRVERQPGERPVDRSETSAVGGRGTGTGKKKHGQRRAAPRERSA